MNPKDVATSDQILSYWIDHATRLSKFYCTVRAVMNPVTAGILTIIQTISYHLPMINDESEND